MTSSSSQRPPTPSRRAPDVIDKGGASHLNTRRDKQLTSLAVESALWTGNLPSLGADGRTPPFPATSSAAPSPLSSLSGPPSFTLGPRLSGPFLSPTWNLGQPLVASPPASVSSSGPSAAGTLAARRGSTGGFQTEPVVGSPVGIQSSVKPFIQKLSHLLSHPEAYADCFSWDAAGTAFIIHHYKRLHTEIPPRMFSHSNSASLTRQLNVYGFRRLTNSELSSRIDVANTAGYSGWIHAGFTRDEPNMLHLLLPRPSRARQLKRDEKEQAGQERGGRTARASRGGRGGACEYEGEEGGEEADEEFSPEERRASEASTSSSHSSELLTPTSPTGMASFGPSYPEGGGTFDYLDPSLIVRK